MSYDIYLHDPITGNVIDLDNPHDMKGGTFALGGTTSAWLNVTYNYAEILYRVLGEKGIRSIYGQTAAQARPALMAAAAWLKDDRDPDYWKPTEGNVKAALLQLVALGDLRPDGVWGGD